MANIRPVNGLTSQWPLNELAGGWGQTTSQRHLVLQYEQLGGETQADDGSHLFPLKTDCHFTDPSQSMTKHGRLDDCLAGRAEDEFGGAFGL